MLNAAAKPRKAASRPYCSERTAKRIPPNSLRMLESNAEQRIVETPRKTVPAIGKTSRLSIGKNPIAEVLPDEYAFSENAHP